MFEKKNRNENQIDTDNNKIRVSFNDSSPFASMFFFCHCYFSM